MLYADLTLPDDVRDALVDDINHLPLAPFKDILEHDSDFARGFRPDPKNLATFRKKLVERLLNPNRTLERGEVWAIRAFGFNMKLVCVFSTAALTDFFDPLAGFIGGAKLLAGMLVDRRPKVVEWAKARASAGEPLPPPPPDPETARAVLCRCFGPFVETMSAALLEPVVKQAAPAADAGLRRDLERAEKKAERTRAELRTARDEAGRLREELRLAGERADAALAAKTAAESAVRKADEDLRTAERSVQKAETRTLAAEEAKTEAERRAREADKRAGRAEEARRAALARAETAEARVAALEAEKAKSAEEAARAEFEKRLVESLPVRIDEFGPAEILSRTFGRKYRRDDPVVFLVDGHNILNLNYPELSKERTNNLAHNEVRYQFVGKCRVLSLGFPNGLTRVFFDGNDARQKVISRNLMIEYSGNPEHLNEHRADRAIVNHVAFLAYRGDVDLTDVFVVSSDQELCSNARAFGVHTIGHSLFADIMAACK